jgi:hypothetical protein
MERMKTGNQRTEELNQRMSSRNTPSHPLQPQFDIRPLSTKYALLPIVDRRENHSEPIKLQPTYDITSMFNPGNAQGPWGGFATNINNESRLRNQFFALQHGAGQSCYIPAKMSDLYTAPNLSTGIIQQPFPGLFARTEFAESNPCPKGLGVNFFENCTRQQVKEIV